MTPAKLAAFYKAVGGNYDSMCSSNFCARGPSRIPTPLANRTLRSSHRTLCSRAPRVHFLHLASLRLPPQPPTLRHRYRFSLELRPSDHPRRHPARLRALGVHPDPAHPGRARTIHPIRRQAVEPAPPRYRRALSNRHHRRRLSHRARRRDQRLVRVLRREAT